MLSKTVVSMNCVVAGYQYLRLRNYSCQLQQTAASGKEENSSADAILRVISRIWRKPGFLLGWSCSDLRDLRS